MYGHYYFINGMTTNDIVLIQEDFVNLKELMSGSYHKQAIELSHQKGHYFLTLDEVKELKQIPASESALRDSYLDKKAAPRIFPLWYLVVSLCRLLQKGENEFTAHDAWYFGLVDEVTGSHLPSIREWRELRHAAPKQLPPGVPAPPGVSAPPSGQSEISV